MAKRWAILTTKVATIPPHSVVFCSAAAARAAARAVLGKRHFTIAPVSVLPSELRSITYGVDLITSLFETKILRSSVEEPK